MLKSLKVSAFILLVFAVGFLSRIHHEDSKFFLFRKISFTPLVFSPDNILSEGNGIIFLEITDRMDPPALVLCSIESAARVYHDRPVVFFMSGLPDMKSEDDQIQARKILPVLSSFENVYLFPLRMEKLYADTPLFSWYKKIKPELENFWIHVSSDGCRFASMWKYGGIYMDTDVISLRPIPHKNFLAAETLTVCSSSVFGLDDHHNFTWKCMEDFVKNYNGAVWGHQGPGLLTRVMKEWCVAPTFHNTDDASCGSILYLHPQRLYPISYPSWRRYFEVWPKIPTFNDSYSLHLWNYMNKEHMTVVPGSNTLVDHLFQQHCPTTYASLLTQESVV
ncbi:alpha-1,4-N-acetylglucosaminyltransferase-like [Spea bombifrons]|uniref:alpha-1,4-N-acetylglucosaminyltransferase-like n=1 Tax=Spea bombifrons TaxID=233779 RepID=UPI0023499C18|nr:alpha-1,4-N-acetylglucosaminyltransferase-like [Spea bombifrons]